MSDLSVASLSFDVNTSALRAGSDELTRFEQRLDSAAAAVRRLEAISATAMSRTSPMMGGMAGPSPASGSQTAAGLAAQAAVATSAATAHTGLATATTAATTALGVQANALHGATTAHKAHGAAMGNSTLQALELAHVSRALFDEWASGQSIMRALLLEGGRIQIMLSNGGLGGLFAQITGKVAEFTSKAAAMANPFTIGAAAVAGFGVATLTALSNVRNLREEMDRAVSGVGRFSGLSGEGLDALARGATASSALSPSSGLPLGDARSAAEAMARTGRMSPDTISGGLGMVRGYAAAFGTSYDEAGSKLADIFRDPVKGADELNERLGFLDARTRTYIQSLRDQGDAQAAVAALQAAVAPSLNEQVKPPGTWERFTNWWSARNDQVEHGLARSFGNLTPEERLAAAERDAENRRLVGATSYDPNDDPLNLSENIRRASQLRAQEQRNTIFNRSSLEVDSVMGRIDPDAARYRQLQNQSKLLGEAAANPDITSRLPDGMSSGGKLVSGADLLAETLGKVNDKLSNWMSGVEKSTLAVNANVMGINAWTLGEHLAAATAQEMASLGIRQIRTGEELIAVQARQADIIARANDTAYNLAKDAADRLSLAGKTGLERTLAEIDLKFRDHRDQLVDMTGGKDLEGIGAAFLPAKAAATGFATILDTAAPKIETAGGHLVQSVETLATKLDVAAGRINPAAAAAASPFGALDRGAFGSGAAPTPFFAAGSKAYDVAPANIRAMIDDAAARTGMPAGIIAALGQKENGFQLTGATKVLGADGRPATSAYGFGQLTNGAAADVAKMIPGFSKFDPNTAVLGAAEYLKIVLGRHSGDMQGALDAYGTGPGYGADVLRRAGGDMGPLTIHAAAAHAAAGWPLPPERPPGLGGGLSNSVLGVKLDTAGNVADAYRDTRVAAVTDATVVPLKQANTALENQIAMLDTQRDMFGKSQAAIEGATRAQTLWNSLVTNSAAPAGELAHQTGALADRVRLYGSEVERVAQQQEDFDRMRKGLGDASDFARGGLSSVLTSGVTAAAHGRSFWDAAKGTLGQIGDQLIGKGISGAVGGLFGGPGSVLGSGGLFGASGGGGFLSSLFGSFFGGAHAAGGPIMGPGSGTSDSILARVSNGEYIMRAAAVQHYGDGIMDRLNSLSFPKFADGGLVGASDGQPMVSMPAGSQVGILGSDGPPMAGRGGGQPVQIHLGDLHVHPATGDQFSDSQLQAMAQMHAQTQQKAIDHITRNLPQIQSDSRQF